MATPQEQRRLRLASDYTEMMNIRGNVIQWEGVEGSPPHVEKYKLIVHVKSIIGPQPLYRDSHTITVTLPPTYPNTAPLTVMTTRPQPYHPNWFVEGRWCYGTWVISEGLGHHVLRMIRTLQFDEAISNVGSPANKEAAVWYQQHLRSFPCDRTQLPDPTVRAANRKAFRIEGIQSGGASRKEFRITSQEG